MFISAGVHKRGIPKHGIHERSLQVFPPGLRSHDYIGHNCTGHNYIGVSVGATNIRNALPPQALLELARVRPPLANRLEDLACAGMAYVVMACAGMACAVMAYVFMAYIVMAYISIAYIVMAYIVMASIVMACTVMANDLQVHQ